MQAIHLRFAEGMDGGGVFLECRELPDLGPVKGPPVGQVVGGERRSGAGQVFIAHEFEQFPVCRLNAVTDDADRLGAQARLIGLRYAGHVLERRVEKARLRARLGDRGDRSIAPGQSDSRRRESALESLAHFRCLFAEIPRDVAHLRDPIAIIL